jgi:transposase
MGTDYYAAIDLHSNNGYCVVVDGEDRPAFNKRLANDLNAYLDAFRPYKKKLVAIAVESTFNWYWLVDGLVEHGYDVRLVHTAAVDQYSGLKHANDKSDAFFLARLLLLGILPTGHIYPCAERPVRDLLRRRQLLVQQRTTQILSFHSLMYRQTGARMNSNEIRQMSKDPELAAGLFNDKHLQLMADTSIGVISYLAEQIGILEKAALTHVKLKPEFECVLSAPGIGKILALIIMLETGNIHRFPSASNYVSYCRCVCAERSSNGKSKGKNNAKNGNRYLAWAYIEAANYAMLYYDQPRNWYMRKVSRSLPVVARKAMAAKMCRACYYLMRDQTVFDMRKLFG